MKRPWDGRPSWGGWVRGPPGAGDASKRGTSSEHEEVPTTPRPPHTTAHAHRRVYDPRHMVLLEHLPGDISSKELTMLRDPDQFGPFLDVNIAPADDGSCSGIFTYQTMEAMSCAATSLERRQMDGWARLLRARCWRPPWGGGGRGGGATGYRGRRPRKSVRVKARRRSRWNGGSRLASPELTCGAGAGGSRPIGGRYRCRTRRPRAQC